MTVFRVLLTLRAEPRLDVAGTYTVEDDRLPAEGALISVQSDDLPHGEHAAQVLKVTPGDLVPIQAFQL